MVLGPIGWRHTGKTLNADRVKSMLEVFELIFITLAKFRRKPTKEEVARTPERIQQAGGKIISAYWTLGRYDAILVTEAKDEKTVMKTLLQFGDFVATETLVAVPREEAIRML